MRAVRSAFLVALAVGLLISLGASASAAGPGGWDHLGVGATPSLSALNGKVDALYNAGSTALYAGGVFTSAGGDPAATMIARWDGAGWNPIGPTAISTATGASVDAIAYDRVTGRVFVGGNFINAGGNSAADFVAYWNGFTWQSPCAISPEGDVTSLQIIGRTLYVGGAFAPPSGLPTGQSLLACDIDSGVTTSTVNAALDMNGSIYALTADSAGNLYAAGTFINMDQTANSNYVARYDGAAWHAMVPGAVTGITRSIASDGTNVYIGSDGLNIGSVAEADHIARWNGSAWSALGANSANADGWLPATASINSIAASAAGVFVAGSFQNADGQTTADEVAQFDGVTWKPLGSDGAGNGPLAGSAANAITLFGSRVIVGGNFTSAGGDPLAGYIASRRVFNVAPNAPITVADGFHGANTALAYSLAADPDGTIASYRWNWGDGSPDTFDVFASHRYAAPGTYTITLTVTDNDGAQASSTASVTVRTGPTASFTFSPAAPVVGQNVTFTSHSTDPDGTIVKNGWLYTPLVLGPQELPFFNPTAGPTEVHAFSKAGDFDIRLTVTECSTCGVSVFTDQTLTVVPAPIPTISKAGLSNAKFRVGTGATAVTAKAPKGTSFKFTLAAPATMTIAIARSAPGVKRGKSCVAAPKKLKKHAKKCTRAIRAGTLTRKSLQPGANTVVFTGRIGKKALTPGAYVATLTARNAKGKAKPITIRFTVVK